MAGLEVESGPGGARAPSGLASGAMALTLRLSRALGVAPVSLTVTDRTATHTAVRVSHYHAMYGYILVTIINVFQFADFYVNYKQWQTSLASITMNVIEKLTTVAVASIGVYGGIGRMTRFIHYLNILEKITSRYVAMNFDSFQSGEKQKKILVTLTMFSHIVILLMGTFVVVSNIGSLNIMQWLIYAAYEIQFLMFESLQLQSILLISAVGTALNVLLLQIQKPPPLVTDHTKTTQHVICSRNLDEIQMKNYQQIIDSYDLVCEVVNNMNEVDGAVLLIISARFTIYLTGSIYNIISEIYERGAAFSRIYIAMEVSWMSLYIGLLIVFIELCHRAEQRALRIRVRLCDWLPALGGARAARRGFRLAVRWDALLLNRLAFSPLAVLEINRSLLTSITSIVTSYLVIILQYEITKPVTSKAHEGAA